MTAPWTALAHMLGHPYMQHAFLAGTAIAAAAGLVGWFLVLRGQVFTADALSHVAFTGARYPKSIAVINATGTIAPAGFQEGVRTWRANSGRVTRWRRPRRVRPRTRDGSPTRARR